ncbi:hypothetical protein EIP86_006727, partial [Pleurotus ostreatoroseus]
MSDSEEPINGSSGIPSTNSEIDAINALNALDARQGDASTATDDAETPADGVSRVPAADGSRAAASVPEERANEDVLMDTEDARQTDDGAGKVNPDDDGINSGSEGDRDEVHDVVAPKRQSKTRAERDASRGQKAGNRGRFRGPALVFMQGLYAEYEQIDKVKGSRGKLKRLADFWHHVGTALWENFTWKDLDVDRLGDERKVVEAVNKAIPGWFQRRESHRHTAEKNPWKEVLSALRKPSGNAPKRLPAYMLYSSENATTVTAACTNKANIGERNRKAKELFEMSTQEVRQHYEAAVERKYEEDLTAHTDALSGLPSLDPEERAKARDRLAEVVTPLLELLGEYTGFTSVTLIGGMAQGDSWLCKSVNVGKTKDAMPKRFDEWDPAGFRKNFCGQFVRFVKECTKEGESIDSPLEATGADQLQAPNISGVAGISSNATTAQTAVPNTTTSNVPGGQHPQDATPSTHHTPDCEGQDIQTTASQSRSRSRSRSRSHSRPLSSESESSDEDEIPPGVRAVLLRRVNSLSPMERRAEIRRLKNMEEIELDRENNVAERQDMFSQIGLDMTVKKTAKRKAKPRPRPVLRAANENQGDSVSRRTRSAAGIVQNDTNVANTSTAPGGTLETSMDIANENPDATSASSASGVALYAPASLNNSTTPDALPRPEGEAAASNPSSAASSTSAASTTSHTPSFSGAPAWLEKQYGLLAAEDMPTAHRELWLSTLRTWWEFERACEFEEMKPGLPTTHRPSDIALWIQNARKHRIVPKNVDAYVGQWWKWWIALNPPWRELEDGRPVATGSGDWSTLFKSGRNGFLTVLASLLGLYAAAESEEWTSALVDVHWVLSEVLAAKYTSGPKRARMGDDEDENEAPDDPEPPSKRRKRRNVCQVCSRKSAVRTVRNVPNSNYRPLRHREALTFSPANVRPRIFRETVLSRAVFILGIASVADRKISLRNRPVPLLESLSRIRRELMYILAYDPVLRAGILRLYYFLYSFSSSDSVDGVLGRLPRELAPGGEKFMLCSKTIEIVTVSYAESLTWQDGLSGCYTADKKYVVLSSVRDCIPEPVYGVLDVSLGPDGYFGAADPLLHPQILEEETKFPWLLAVPRDAEASPALQPVLWHALTPDDVEVISAPEAIRTCIIKVSFREDLEGPYNTVRSLVDVREKLHGVNHVLRWLFESLSQTFNRLGFPGTFRDLARQFACFRRYALYIHAWFQWYHAIKSPTAIPSIVRIDNDKLMGGFITSPVVAQELFKLRITYWWLRPTSSFAGNEVIQKIVSFTPSPRHLPVDDAHLPRLREELEGRLSSNVIAGDPHIEWINRQSATYLDIEKRPYPELKLGRRPSPPSSVPTSSQEKPVEVVETPAVRRTQQTVPIAARGSSSILQSASHIANARPGARPQPALPCAISDSDKMKLQPFSHPCFPPPLESWQTALSSIQPLRKITLDEQWGYWVPEARMVVTSQKDDRQKRHVFNWLRVREPWLAGLASSNNTHYGPLRASQWREYLGASDVWLEQLQRESKRASFNRDVASLFRTILGPAGFNKELPQMLFGIEVSTEQRDEWVKLCQRVAWELIQIGFRCELFALDRRLVPNDEHRRDKVVADVFPPAHGVQLKDFPSWSRGL